MVGFYSTFSVPISPFLARSVQHLSDGEEYLNDQKMAISGRTRTQFMPRRNNMSRNCRRKGSLRCNYTISSGFSDTEFELPDASIVGLSDLDSDPEFDIESDVLDSKFNSKTTSSKYGSKLRGNYFKAREKKWHLEKVYFIATCLCQ